MTKRVRIKAAIVIAVLYAFCVLAPSVALAFTDGAVAAHCLTDQHGISAAQEHGGKLHVHADGSSHRHAEDGVPHKHTDGDGKAHSGNCCGLFCMSAISHESGVAFGATTYTLGVFVAPDVVHASRGPDRLIRPPIS